MFKRSVTERIVIHSSQSVSESNWGVKDLEKFLGKTMSGFHYVIKRDGSIEEGINISNVGHHAQGYDSKSIGICLVGGAKRNAASQLVSSFNYTEEQLNSLSHLVDHLRLNRFPTIKQIVGFNDVSKHSDSPCFNVTEWLETGQVEELSGRSI